MRTTEKIKIRVPESLFSWQLLNGPIADVIERLQWIEHEQYTKYGLDNIKLNCVVRSDVNIGGVNYPVLEVYITGERNATKEDQFIINLNSELKDKMERDKYLRLKAKYDPDPTFKELQEKYYASESNKNP